MNSRAILAIARKDVLEVLLNKQLLIVVLMIPIMSAFFLFMGRIIGRETVTNLLVYDPDYKGAAAGLVGVVSQGFGDVKVTLADSPEEVARAFGPDRDGSYAVGLVVPGGFEESLRAGERPIVRLYLDGDEVGESRAQLLQAALVNYARGLLAPDPVRIEAQVVNPPRSSPVADINKFYLVTALAFSFVLGSMLAPWLLVEEVEKKTIKVLMVSPASWWDIVLAKALVAGTYQLAMSLLVPVIMWQEVAHLPWLLLFILGGTLFSVALGLLIGGILRSQGAVQAFSGMSVFAYMLPVFLANPLLPTAQGDLGRWIRVLPTYWLTDGISASVLQSPSGGARLVVDLLISLGFALLFGVAAVRYMRRQAEVAAAL